MIVAWAMTSVWHVYERKTVETHPSGRCDPGTDERSTGADPRRHLPSIPFPPGSVARASHRSVQPRVSSPPSSKRSGSARSSTAGRYIEAIRRGEGAPLHIGRTYTNGFTEDERLVVGSAPLRLQPSEGRAPYFYVSHPSEFIPLTPPACGEARDDSSCLRAPRREGPEARGGARLRRVRRVLHGEDAVRRLRCD